MKTSQYPGISVGKHSIRMEFLFKGRRCRETVRVEPTPENLKLVKRKRDRVQMKIDFGEFDYAAEFPESKLAFEFSENKAALLTVAEMCEQWFKHSHKNWAYSTLKANSGRMDNHILPNFGHVRVSDFKPSHFREWQRKTKLNPKTANEVHSLLSQAFDYLVYDDIIGRNPMKSVKRLKTERKDVYPFSPSERKRILEGLPVGYVRDFYEFAFWTGLRTGEQIALTWDNVNLKEKLVNIDRSIVKGMLTGTKTLSSARIHELSERALNVLVRIKTYNAGSEYVFLDPRTMTHWKNDGILRERFWTPTILRVNVKYRRPYNCRHTYASTMLSLGKNPLWVAKQMGHRDWGMLIRVYGKWCKQ